MSDDPLDAALAALTGAPAVEVGPDGLLRPRTLRTLQETADAFGSATRTVAYWRKKPWWPGSLDPDPWEVCAHRLDAALRAQGLATASARLASSGAPLELRGGHRDPRLRPSAALADEVELEDLAKALEPSDSLTEDIKRLREVAERCRVMAMAVKPQALADPARARVWNSVAQTYTQAQQRIAQLERALLAVQRERGEVVAVEAAQLMAGAMVTACIEESRAMRADVLDAVKRAELEAHGVSKLDPLILGDVMEGAMEAWRGRVAQRIRAALEVGE